MTVLPCFSHLQERDPHKLHECAISVSAWQSRQGSRSFYSSLAMNGLHEVKLNIVSLSP